MISQDELINMINLLKNIDIQNLPSYVINEVGEILKEGKNLLLNSESIRSFLQEHNDIIGLFSFFLPILSPLLGPELGITTDIISLTVLSIIFIYQEKSNIIDFIHYIYSLNHKIYEKLKYEVESLESFL